MTFDPKIDKGGQGASGSDRCESSLIDLLAKHDLVDRFCLDHPGREMWIWTHGSPSVQVGATLDRVLIRRGDSEYISCPMFH